MMKKAIPAEIQKSTSETGVFAYGGEIIHYDIIRRAMSNTSRTRKVVIKVHPDQRVVAIVPDDATTESINNAVLKRARWIWDSIREFASQKDYVFEKQYISGEPVFYLGKRYMLKVIENSELVPSVKLSRGKLNVTLKANMPNKKQTVKGLLNTWYKQKAKATFHERLNEMLLKATWVEGLPRFRIMAMKTQWGSCSTQGNLMLNPHLVKAPKECIDYVILHELCHIAEHNHSEKFWRLLTQVMPNWKEVKAKLDDMAELYLNE
ncbi:M48 family metallopeptidase [Aestuariibacter sp. GS-14]|uniref:M48 family metallopeptidase n=1 Tax=Aestuariibacter sp. GS-14 TaxID=2590670 RepID=UPI00112CC135|nr:SprT family zinc-dependent metalloprotease [Aestuariibacter sp. GS-14]TPV62010.1 M48 family metallopeptidase [Aestuariibacter sp. GS-14]